MENYMGPAIAIFPIMADVVQVKTEAGSTAHWSIHFIRLNGWLRHSFAQLITLLDIDGIGQYWEDSNKSPSIIQRELTVLLMSQPCLPYRSTGLPQDNICLEECEHIIGGRSCFALSGACAQRTKFGKEQYCFRLATDMTPI